MDSNLSRGLHYPQPREEEGPHAEMKRKNQKSRKNVHGPLSLNIILHDTLMIVIKLFLTVMQEVILIVEETGTMDSAYYGWSISQQNAVQ